MSMSADSFPGPRAFARHMLQEDRLFIRPELDSIAVFSGYAIELVLFREACWQVELITMFPGAVVPMHRHNRCNSVDLMLGGTSSTVVVDGRRVSPIRRGPLLANLVRVAKGAWHAGQPQERGAVYLSFQQWDGEPALISEDWEPWSPESR
jgi:hypothetical protein